MRRVTACLFVMQRCLLLWSLLYISPSRFSLQLRVSAEHISSSSSLPERVEEEKEGLHNAKAFVCALYLVPVEHE